MTPAMERTLIVALQAGLPLVERPFTALADRHGSDEESLLALAQTMQADGRARRFGCIFETARIAVSTLCAFDTEHPAKLAAQLRTRSSVTHCYERDGRPNLWFTVTATRERIDDELAEIARAAATPILHFPMQQRFKLGVVLDPNGSVVPPASALAATPLPVELTRTQRRLVHALQGALPISATPFDALAQRLGWELPALVAQLQRWQADGVLRRLALVCRHRKMGFNGNLMAVWDLPAEAVAEAGALLTASPHVSHCYERPRHPEFPYNLYAMLHAENDTAVLSAAEALTAALGQPPFRAMTTLREFKKISPQPFAAEFKEPS